LVLLACGGSQEPAPAAPAPAPVASAAPAGSGTAAPASATSLSPIVEEAIGRVQGLTADPSDAAIQSTFSKAFLAAVSADKVKSLFTSMHGDTGACTQHTAVKVKDETSAIVRLQCEHGAVNAAIVVNPAPPHLVEGLLLKPAS
jgi:hypothetical protein